MLFSVITVARNSEKTIARTIESVLGQSFNDFEYIIRDGLSTDNTLKIIDSYRDKFDKRGIKLTVVSEKDTGIYDAMNKGIEMASGTLINLINSDDWLEPNALETIAEEYNKNHSDFIYGNIYLIKNNGSKIIKKSKKMKHYFTTRHWNHPSSFISKDLYTKMGMYKNKTIYDDWDLMLRIFKSDARISVVNKVIANFTMNGVSHSRGFKKAIGRARIKKQIYLSNGYSHIYWFECYLMEIIKSLIN